MTASPTAGYTCGELLAERSHAASGCVSFAGEGSRCEQRYQIVDGGFLRPCYYNAANCNPGVMVYCAPPTPPPPSPPPSPPAPPFVPGVLCDNTCTSGQLAAVGDGVCDDGGAGAEYDHCAFGSDCVDCGTRQAASCEN
jgi:hypothetical protein